MYKVLFFLTLLSLNAFALEIDEKLTTRVVKSSVSKKTVLINRGIEDGLAVGDHAKFYVSIGVVARGVVIKASPARSVWSLYRLVNSEYIREQQVLKLKITPAVKITKDESKAFISDDKGERGAITAGDPRDLGIPLAEGADDLDASSSSSDGQLLKEFSGGSVSLFQKNIEIFGTLNFDARSINSKTDVSGDEGSDTKTSSLGFRLGGEYYFKKEKSWLSRISLLAQLALTRSSTEADNGDTTRGSSIELGFGINIHPFSKPFLSHKLIPYLNYTLNVGTAGFGFTSKADSSQDFDTSASIFAHNLGAGLKYYTTSGVGLRAELSFVIRQDKSEVDGTNATLTQTSLGPSFFMGASYRF